MMDFFSFFQGRAERHPGDNALGGPNPRPNPRGLLKQSVFLSSALVGVLGACDSGSSGGGGRSTTTMEEDADEPTPTPMSPASASPAPVPPAPAPTPAPAVSPEPAPGPTSSGDPDSDDAGPAVGAPEPAPAPEGPTSDTNAAGAQAARDIEVTRAQPGHTRLIFRGQTEDAALGEAVARAGDVNGDGLPDFLLGAPQIGSETLPDAGEAYLVFGTSRVLNPASLPEPRGLVFRSTEEGAFLGDALASPGDINGDGLADIVLGAPFGALGDGVAYVLYGQTTLADEPVLEIGTPGPREGFVLQGDVLAGLGWSVAGAGDVNGDGIEDLLLGAIDSSIEVEDENGDLEDVSVGRVYLIYGMADQDGSQFGEEDENGTYVLDVTDLEAAEGFALIGDLEGDLLGWSVAGIGDINGDGLADFAAGASNGSDGRDDDSDDQNDEDEGEGEVYVIFGRADRTRQELDSSFLAPQDGFVIEGSQAGDAVGFSVASAGDVNGDGLDELLIGAPEASDAAGEAYLIWGRPGPFGTEVDVHREIGFTYTDADDPANPDPDRIPRRVLDLEQLTPTDGLMFRGAPGSHLGWAVSSGDVNGDGLADLLIGATKPAERRAADSQNSGATDDNDGQQGSSSPSHGDGDASDGDASDGDASDGSDADEAPPASESDSQGAQEDTPAPPSPGLTPLPPSDSVGVTNTAPIPEGGTTEGGTTEGGTSGSGGGTPGSDGTSTDAGVPGTSVSSPPVSVSEPAPTPTPAPVPAPTPDPEPAAPASYVYIVYGQAADAAAFGAQFGDPAQDGRQIIDLADLDLVRESAQIARLSSVDPEDGFGSAVDAVGDVDNDGFLDLLVGAPSAARQTGTPPQPTQDVGEASLIYGESAFGNIASGALQKTSSPGDEALYGAAGDDTLTENADGAVHTFYGGRGDDRFVLADVADADFRRVDGGLGQDTLVLSGGMLDLTATRAATTDDGGASSRNLVRSVETLSLNDAAAELELDVHAVYALTEQRDNGGARTSAGEVLIRIQGTGRLILSENTDEDDTNDWTHTADAEAQGTSLYRLQNAVLWVDDGLMSA